MEELHVRVEREQALLAQIEDVQTSLDKKAYIQGTEVFQKLYQYVYNIQTQVPWLCVCVKTRTYETCCTRTCVMYSVNLSHKSSSVAMTSVCVALRQTVVRNNRCDDACR